LPIAHDLAPKIVVVDASRASGIADLRLWRSRGHALFAGFNVIFPITPLPRTLISAGPTSTQNSPFCPLVEMGADFPGLFDHFRSIGSIHRLRDQYPAKTRCPTNRAPQNPRFREYPRATLPWVAMVGSPSEFPCSELQAHA
jgi:hypothetical protein